MKIFTFSFKSLLLAAGLMLGSANVWAKTYSGNVDFVARNRITNNGDGTFTTAGNAGNQYALALADLSGLENIASATSITLEFDVTIGGRLLIGIGDKSTRGTTAGSSSKSSYDTGGLVMRYGTSDGTYVRVNGGTNNSNLLNTSSHVTFTLDRTTGKYSYTITYVNGESVVQTGLSGSNLSTSVSNATIVEAYTWANNQTFSISNISYSYEYTSATEVAIIDCKQYETSAAFATAVDAESFSTAAEVYAFHTNWQIENAGSNDITKVIRNANIADETDWDGARILSGEKYTGAPDEYYLDQYQATINSSQTIYGVPAGKYTIKAATRANAGLVNGWLYVNDGTSDIAKVDINRNGNTGGTLGNGWSWSEMTFVITETKNLLIGFYANASATGIWAGCDTWKMTLVATPKTPQSSANLDGWKTFYNADSNYKVDENTTIYKASEYTANTSVTLTSVAGKIVPANTPVVLKTTDAGYNITLTPTASDSEGDFTGNLLGVYKSGEWSKSGSLVVYMLGYTASQGFGLYQFGATPDEGDVAVLVNAGGAKSLRVIVDGEASEVVAPEVAETEEPEVLYNMAGIQVDKNFKGFVVNQKGVKRFNR